MIVEDSIREHRTGHLSWSIHWRTGQVFVTEAAPKQGCNGALFINAGCHTSLEVIQYLWKWEGRIEVHLLPSYSAVGLLNCSDKDRFPCTAHPVGPWAG